MGLRMYVPEGQRLWALRTPRVPEGIDEAIFRQYLLQERGIEIAGGFGPLAGQIFRIGTMGEGSTAENVLLILREFEAALKQQGCRPAGDAASAAERVLSGAKPILAK